MGWEKEWRIKGVPEETRYSSPEEAIRARRRVQSMKPGRTKGKREVRSNRPNCITAERIHHSRGRKWDEFLEATGYHKLSKPEQLLLMDGFKLGGSGLFAAWKQREYERWIPIKKVSFMDYSDRKVILVQLQDGTIVERPFVDKREEKEKQKKSRRSSKLRNCATCGIRIPTTHQYCGCKPAVSAGQFFQNVKKAAKKKEESSG